jgi:hypothetical protein
MRRVIGLVVLLALVAGCDGAPAGPDVASAATGGPAPSASQARDIVGEIRRWTQCMRDQGIAMPDPDPGGKIVGFDWNQGGKGSAQADTYARAEEACRPYEVVTEVERRPLGPEELALWRDWAACMREHGADQPDPDLYGFEAENEGRGDPAEGQLRAVADEACLDKMVAARVAGAEQR